MLQGVGHGATESVAILRDHFGYCRIDCHTIAKIRVPTISFGITKRKKDKLVLLSKHKRVIIGLCSECVQIDVGPMGRES